VPDFDVLKLKMSHFPHRKFTRNNACPQEVTRKKTPWEQMYLGDIISSDGRHKKNVQARKNKGLGIINKIMQIIQSMFFGKYYFEVALALRSSLLLSSLLLNS
jgi:hypothetical protein